MSYGQQVSAIHPPSGKKLLWHVYKWSLGITLIIFGVTFWARGFSAVFLVLVLTVLEVTFSFDNAVVNAKVLDRMSEFWQKIFLTVGIFVAVFVVRFYLPLLIVQLTAGLGFMEVVNLVLHDSAKYGEELHKAGPVIEAFGGMFLLMIGVNYFLDHEKDTHWLGWLESRLAPLGRFDNLVPFSLTLLSVVLLFTVNEHDKYSVFTAAIMGILLHMGLDLLGALLGSDDDGSVADEIIAKSTSAVDGAKKAVGKAAFALFVYLEFLDASFSFDGVIGAFAITTDVVVIVAGLGTGAVFVRSMTVHLVRAGTLDEYRFLEHGAHWAILALGLVMISKIYHVELPEVVTGSIGLVFILAAFYTSVRLNKRDKRADELAAQQPLTVKSLNN